MAPEAPQRAREHIEAALFQWVDRCAAIAGVDAAQWKIAYQLEVLALRWLRRLNDTQSVRLYFGPFLSGALGWEKEIGRKLQELAQTEEYEVSSERTFRELAERLGLSLPPAAPDGHGRRYLREVRRCFLPVGPAFAFVQSSNFSAASREIEEERAGDMANPVAAIRLHGR